MTSWGQHDDIPSTSTTGATSEALLATLTNVRLGKHLWIECTAGECYINFGAAASATAKRAHLIAGQTVTWGDGDGFELNDHATLTITFIRVGATNATCIGGVDGEP